MDGTSETYLDWDPLARCEYTIPSSAGPDYEADCGDPAAYHVWWTLEDGTPSGEMDLCFYHWQKVMRGELEGQDMLEQWAVDNADARLAALMDAIAIAAETERTAPGAASSIAAKLKYKTPTVLKLAAMRRLPDDCINLELPVGTYWVAIQHFGEDVDAVATFLREWAIPEMMSPAEAKKALGIETVRKSRLREAEAEVKALKQHIRDIADQVIGAAHGPPAALLAIARRLLERVVSVEDDDG